ncbi:MAG: type II secretion system F family protein, partial [Patescibacteria group bacterium]
QMATLFEAQVSPLKIFTLLASEVENLALSKSLNEVVADIQSGSTISKALSKHPQVFSSFYVNMVKAGEETGKLNETFGYLADHLDRNYEVVSKAKNALIYPAFVIGVFIAVMVIMFTVIIPKISTIIIDSGQELPLYTRVVFGVSDLFVNYGFIMAALLIVALYFLVHYIRTQEGASAWARFKLDIPYLGNLYRKIYISIIADNMNTMILSGIPMVKAIEVTVDVVDNEVYKKLLEDTLSAVKSGSPLSQSLSQYEEIPTILVQMIKVGEETGGLGNIFRTMAHFYQREVVTTIDTLVSLIEPIMIVVLGLGIGILLASVLIPIYEIANSAGV